MVQVLVFCQDNFKGDWAVSKITACQEPYNLHNKYLVLTSNSNYVARGPKHNILDFLPYYIIVLFRKIDLQCVLNVLVLQ